MRGKNKQIIIFIICQLITLSVITLNGTHCNWNQNKLQLFILSMTNINYVCQLKFEKSKI
jgi:hypothetical protein